MVNKDTFVGFRGGGLLKSSPPGSAPKLLRNHFYARYRTRTWPTGVSPARYPFLFEWRVTEQWPNFTKKTGNAFQSKYL